MSIHRALDAARFLWPDLVERGGAVLLAEESGTAAGRLEELAETEILLNHRHVLDRFEHRSALEDPCLDDADWSDAIANRTVIIHEVGQADRPPTTDDAKSSGRYKIAIPPNRVSRCQQVGNQLVVGGG